MQDSDSENRKPWLFVPVIPHPASITSTGEFRDASSESPPHNHIRLDRLPRLLQVGARFVHVEPNRVDLVALGFRQAIASRVTGVHLPGDTERTFRDDPSIARPFR